MVKTNRSKKPPSRKRYEEEHPTISFRLDRQTKEELEDHLRVRGCSYTDFVKNHLREEKSMVQERVEKIG